MKHFLLAVLAVLTIGSATAQSEPITWKITAAPAGDGMYNIMFQAYLTPGYLLYSLHPGADKTLTPPTFRIDPATATVAGEILEQGFTSDLQFPGFDGYTRSYGNEAMFTVPVKAAKGKTVKGAYTYQLRSKQSSLSPKTVPFSVKLP